MREAFIKVSVAIDLKSKSLSMPIHIGMSDEEAKELIDETTLVLGGEDDCPLFSSVQQLIEKVPFSARFKCRI